MDDKEPKIERCPKCGAQVNPNWKLCLVCFQKIEDVADPWANCKG